MSFIKIDKSMCQHDGLCVGECPMGLLAMKENETPDAVAQAEATCLKCGHCAAICPTGALSLEGSAAPLPPVGPAHLAAEEVEHFMRSRRSVRLYRKDPVPREVLCRVLETTRWAPTATNRQPVQWLVVEDPKVVHALSGLVIDGLRTIPYFARAVQAWEAGMDMVLRGAPHVVVAHAPKDGFEPATDCTIAMTYMELAAHALGLGTCWAGMLMGAARVKREIPQLLEIPEGHKLCAAMMLGYPKHHYARIPDREELKVRFL